MMSAPLSLYELNNLVRSAFDTVLYDRYWVKAELGEVKLNRGHCFLEFVQKDEKSNALVAKARGQIWANTWAILRPYFENSTKRQLASGMQVLVCVELTFHEVYGYSLNVTDIDPTYTLGDIARKRQEIIRSLEKAGIAEMNKYLRLPRLLQRIAVISSASAAGYGDFIKQLDGNNKCLKFEVKLFPATMQGDGVESSVIKALDRIAKELDNWDAVVIIRGGGAASDLYGFDTLALGENIAQFPLPVISGIGHERDDTIVDIVAHTRVKTPTAAADFIIRHQEAELNILHEFSERISRECTSLISKEKIRLERVSNKIPTLWEVFKTKDSVFLDEVILRLHKSSRNMIGSKAAKQDYIFQHLSFSSKSFLIKQKHILEIIERQMDMADPERILKLGYSITRINGKAIFAANDLKIGDMLQTTLFDGEIQSVVTEKHDNNTT